MQKRVFDKTQHLFMLATGAKVTHGKFLNMIKSLRENHEVNMICNDEKLDTFSLKIIGEEGHPFLYLLNYFHH
jgi:hypothetical protein